ncbi:hypothetical protein [Dyella sp.]|uniref:hypothetical protein n=1 Tax=Dyella sp. TaxID=1869338 RepID=UPI002840D154|nr:hypothetical protein [Dyella sp.]MDR3446671.1 hypothetical protein [Dyella sp.]
MAYLDLVADILQRVADRHPIPAGVLSEIEQEARDDWGGERHYVAKVGECGRAKLAARDQQIRDAYSRGVTEEYLSLRHNLGLRRIRQILASGPDPLRASPA